MGITVASTNMNNKNLLSFDEVIVAIGSFGKFQKTLEALLCLLIFCFSFQPYIMFFATLTPPWRCANNSSVCLMKGDHKGEDLTRCHLPRDEWYYTKGKSYSLVTWFDVGCGDQWMLGAASTLHFLGAGIGSLILGPLADKVGRRAILIPSVGMMLLFGFLTAFSPSMYVVLVCRFIIGLFHNGVLVQTYILMMEMVGPNHRNIASMGPFIWTAVGCSMLAVQAYLTQNWITLSIITTVPYSAVVVCMLFFLPESPKWLQATGNVEKATGVLSRIARWNKTELPDFTLSLNPEKVDDADLQIQRKKGPSFIPKTFILILLYFSALGCFFGLMFTVNKLPGNVYLNSFLINIFETLTAVIALPASNRYGRKKINLIPLTCVGCICLVVAAIPTDRGFAVKVALAVMAKFIAMITYEVNLLWSAELYETKIRSTGLGIVQFASRVGTACLMLLTTNATPLWVVYVLLGVCSLVASCLGLLLPETMPRRGKTVIEDPYGIDTTQRNSMWQRVYKKLVLLRSKDLMSELAFKKIDYHKGNLS